jgi:transketolase
MAISSKSMAKAIRLSALKMVAMANASHIGSALSIADLVAVLYTNILRGDPNNPFYQDRDRFVLSKGHACVAVYAALAELGYFHREELETYGVNFSNLMSHISHKVPGVEFSTGSLGHGLPFAVGKAMQAIRVKKNWGVYALLSDGELNEGSNWEAIMFSAHHELNNLTIIIDCNGLQGLGSTDSTLSMYPLKEKLQAFGAEVLEIDGHNHIEIRDSLNRKTKKMKIIIAKTIKGKGVSFMENQVVWHYRTPNSVQLTAALNEVMQFDA